MVKIIFSAPCDALNTPLVYTRMFIYIHPNLTYPQVEIDEYRDYEKALSALSEAVKQLTKTDPAGEKLAQLNKRVFLVER